MGSYTFKWEHPAEEVFVTGTFDNWTKSVKLEKVGSVFQKSVELKEPTTKIYYKYVVDNNWVINETSPKEPDHEGNVNNFLTPADILKSDPSAAFISSVGPQSTTATMAARQPLERTQTPSEIPGGFPATPANELDKPVGINPLPAAAGAINPITLKPGEKVPDATAQDINENVKLDKASYEKSDALAGVDTTIPAGGKGTIPESGGLPMGVATVSTVGAGATTAALAGEVPREDAKVPQVVKESQKSAGAAPEASGVPEEVKEKAEVEEELKAKVPEAPSTSEGAAGFGTTKTEGMTGMAGAAATAATVAVAAAVGVKEAVAPTANQAAVAATQAANENLPDSVKQQLPVSAQQTLAAQNTEDKREEVSPEVPAEVKESIAEAGKSPEAAANTQAVEEKKTVEAELLKETKPVPAVDDKPKETEKVKEAVKEAVPGAKKEESNTQVPANGAGSKPATAATTGTSSSKPAETSTPEKKKKHRLSTMFKKLTGKDKN